MFVAGIAESTKLRTKLTKLNFFFIVDITKTVNERQYRNAATEYAQKELELHKNMFSLKSKNFSLVSLFHVCLWQNDDDDDDDWHTFPY